MATTHTPGPWRVTEVTTEGRIGTASGELIATVFVGMTGDRLDFARKEADTRLIASAPDLLAALEAVKDAAIALEIDYRNRWGENSTTTILHNRIAEAIAVCARAKGE